MRNKYIFTHKNEMLLCDCHFEKTGENVLNKVMVYNGKNFTDE